MQNEEIMNFPLNGRDKESFFLANCQTSNSSEVV